jgi:DHA2 family integral membrane protein (MFS transporter)
VTVAIMGSLPREKAGAGSAINNTFRQVGGSLGVAVLGAVLSTVYRDGISDKLPPQARDKAGESLEATLGFAQKFKLESVVQPAYDSFLHAMHTVAALSAGITFAGALLAWFLLPARMAGPGGAPGGAAPGGAGREGSPESVPAAKG